jgi:5'-nucleotidase
LTLALSSRLSAVDVTLLYWSDRHSHNLPDRALIGGDSVAVGGAANLAGIVNLIRTGSPRPLVLVAGDEFTGTPISSITKGASEVRVLNQLAVNAFTPGNHEFDHGWQSLKTVMTDARFPVLLANVRMETGGGWLFPSDTVLDDGGVKVGVIGLIFPSFTQSVIRDGVMGLTATDPASAAADFVSRRQESCDLLVALTHIGWDGDSALAAAVPGLDVIIGGHSHTPIDPPRVVNGVVICQSGPYGWALGRLTLDVDTVANDLRSWRGELLRVDPSYAPPDRKMKALVKDMEKDVRKLDRKIGTLQTDWVNRRGQPSNLAQWAVDAMLTQARAKISDRINIAVINEGNLRKSMPRGPIRERDIWEICPFENPMLVFQVSGEELIQAVQKQLVAPREFLTWSGLEMQADSGRIVSLKANGYPVEPASEYTVAATGYIWQQIDSYLGLAQDDRPIFYLPGIMQRQLLIDAVLAQKVISTPTDERWDVR